MQHLNEHIVHLSILSTRLYAVMMNYPHQSDILPTLQAILFFLIQHELS